jgi:hypothetical protein
MTISMFAMNHSFDHSRISATSSGRLPGGQTTQIYKYSCEFPQFTSVKAEKKNIFWMLNAN